MKRSTFIRLSLLYGAGLLVYGLLAGPRLGWRLPNEFVALAEALLQGRVHIEPALAPYLDLASYGGRTYVPYPPIPALLYLPAVALLGRGVAHGLLHVLLAAAALPLTWLTLRRYLRQTEPERLWLVALFAFGSVYAPLAVHSSVYYTGQVVAVLLTWLYLLLARRGERPGLAGLALGAAYLARGPLLLAFPFALVEIRDREESRQRLAGRLIRFALGLGLMLLLSAGYNWLRFDNPFELGYRYLTWHDEALVSRWGLFHPIYLERNLQAALLMLPVLLPRFPFVMFNPEGMSLFLTTPVLLLLPTLRNWTRPALAALATALLVALPSLFYANTGFAQYGYRYAADFLPFLLLALALAGLNLKSRRVQALVLAGIVVSTLGAFLAARHFFTQDMLDLIQANTLLHFR